MTGFDDAVALARVSEHDFAWTVPDGWQQGRGAWGGLTVGALVDAVCSVQTDPLRAVSAQLTAAVVPGPHRIRVEPIRRGRKLVTWRAEAWAADGELVASMVLTTGGPRSSTGTGWAADSEPPAALSSADTVAVLPIGPPSGPTFMQHCEFRPVQGSPLSGGPARTAGWVRLLVPPRARAAWLVALVDAWWPAALVSMVPPHPVATVCFAASVLVDPSTLPTDQPTAFRSWMTGSADGFASERRTLWTADGRLAVDNLQTIVIG